MASFGRHLKYSMLYISCAQIGVRNGAPGGKTENSPRGGPTFKRARAYRSLHYPREKNSRKWLAPTWLTIISQQKWQWRRAQASDEAERRMGKNNRPFYLVCFVFPFQTMWWLACVASVSNRVMARKLEREQKKRWKGEERRGNVLLSPPPPLSFLFFALVPTFLDLLARKRLLRRLCDGTPEKYFFPMSSYTRASTGICMHSLWNNKWYIPCKSITWSRRELAWVRDWVAQDRNMTRRASSLLRNIWNIRICMGKNLSFL